MNKLGSLVFGALLLVPVSAQAQEFGTAGRFAISAERMFGVVHSTQSEDDEVAGVEVTRRQSNTTISLLNNPLGGLVSAYSAPRLAADYFVTDGLSIGAALGFAHSSSSTETEGEDTTVETDGPSTNTVLLAPRVGYAFMFDDAIGIWPRLGITYVNASSETDDVESSASRLALTIEAPFVFAPLPHVAFTAGPTLDLGLSGSTEFDPSEPGEETEETDVKATDIGLQLGMLVYF